MGCAAIIGFLVTLIFGGLFGVSTGPVFGPDIDPPVVEPGTLAGAVQRSDAVVENVEMMQLESFPVQISLHVTGYFPHGCEAPLIVEQARNGNHVTVALYQELPADTVCPAVIRPLDQIVRLEGGFESGAYTVDINGYIVEFTI